MQNNQVADLSPLAKTAPLGFLDVSNNQVKDIAPLAGLAKLHALYLTGNPIEDFKPLASLKNIERLDLRGTGISDLSPLAELTEWQSHLFLHGNKITDLSVLVAMAKKDFEGQKRFAPFWKVYLGENPLSDAAKTAQIEELKKYGVRVSLTYP
jgi:Leucine-rich repeat (LRR) protein